jgi:GNAT superfamily N-acetyltransferase
MATARRTYLEMREPAGLNPAAPPAGTVRIARESPCAPALYRRMYLGVGSEYRWIDRAGWTDVDIASHLATPGLEIWIARVDGEEAGFFELEPMPDGSMQIAYFGLLPAFVGRKLGGYLLTEAVRRAWSLGPSRVWLHTCTLDHPAALPNYLARGFTVTRTEEYALD